MPRWTRECGNVSRGDCPGMGFVAIEDVLFPWIDVRVTAVHTAAERVVVEAAACGRPPDCPNCGCAGRRVHSRYRRHLTERPVAGRPLVISLQVRRFFCERAECRRRTFVEQVPDLSERYRRHSVGLRQWTRAIATFLGGRPGQRLVPGPAVHHRPHLPPWAARRPAGARAGTAGTRRRRVRLP
ncbi:transposase family protein [Streptomyces sp. NPDC086182]|uniref:transposase family protein n=1 Tax=Streptomyces sp. NPDC086182 TaxID=3155058 RepID=UPI00341E0F84